MELGKEELLTNHHCQQPVKENKGISKKVKWETNTLHCCWFAMLSLHVLKQRPLKKDAKAATNIALKLAFTLDLSASGGVVVAAKTQHYAVI